MTRSLLIAGFIAALIPAQDPRPRPDDATPAILAAFEAYDVVGMNAPHENKLLDDFILSLIRNPSCPAKSTHRR